MLGLRLSEVNDAEYGMFNGPDSGRVGMHRNLGAVMNFAEVCFEGPHKEVAC